MKVVLTSLTDKITETVYRPPVPVDVSRFFTINTVLATVNYRKLTMEEIKSVWTGLPDTIDGLRPEDTLQGLAIDNGMVFTDEAPFIPDTNHPTDMVTQLTYVTHRLGPNESQRVLVGESTASRYHTGRPEDAYDDSHDRFGWRKPGMHVRNYPEHHNPLTHGPGKRKKKIRK